MEIKREKLDPSDFRVRQLQARDMLRGEMEEEALQKYIEESVMTTTVEKAVAWARGNSFFPLTLALLPRIGLLGAVNVSEVVP